MANIKINDIDQRIQYTATAGQTVFTVPFVFLANSEIQAYQNGVLLTLTTDYTLTGANTEGGGTLTLTVGASLNDIITILGVIPFDRTSIYTAALSRLTGSSLNNDFNRELLMLKQLETYDELLQPRYAPWAEVSQDKGVTIDRELPILPAGTIWRKNDANSAIEAVEAPGAIAGISPATGFTNDNRIVRTDTSVNAFTVQQSVVTLSDAGAITGVTALTVDDITLNGTIISSASTLDLQPTTNLNLTPGNNLTLKGIQWPNTSPALGQALTASSPTTLTWSTIVSMISLPANDNDLIRADGTAGAIQGGPANLSDAGLLTGVTDYRISNGNGITDENGNNQLLFNTTAAAVNWFEITNAVTTGNPVFRVDGTDASIGINFAIKGNEAYSFLGTSSAQAKFRMYEDTSNGGNFLTLQVPAAMAASETLTLPEATDTLMGRATTDTMTNKTFDANGTGNSLSNVDVEDLADGTDGELITWDAAGAPTTVATGVAGQVLTTQGAGAVPVWDYTNAVQNAAYNGAFQIWQRGTTFNNPSVNTYGPDRFSVDGVAGATDITVSQDSDAAEGYEWSVKFQRTAASSNTGVRRLSQVLTSEDSYQFQGKVAVLRFWAKAGANYSSAGNVLVSRVGYGTGTNETLANWNNGVWTGQTVDDQNNTLTTNWQEFTHTFTFSAGMSQAAFQFRSTPTGTAGADDSFYVTGVRYAPVSNPSERTQVDEYFRCQYFYFQSTPEGVAITTATAAGALIAVADSTAVASGVRFSRPMRTAPTITIAGTDGNSGTVNELAAGTQTGTTVTAANINRFGFTNISDSGSNFTAGDVYKYHFSADAEL